MTNFDPSFDYRACVRFWFPRAHCITLSTRPGFMVYVGIRIRGMSLTSEAEAWCSAYWRLYDYLRRLNSLSNPNPPWKQLRIHPLETYAMVSKFSQPPGQHEPRNRTDKPTIIDLAVTDSHPALVPGEKALAPSVANCRCDNLKRMAHECVVAGMCLDAAGEGEV